MEPDPGLLAEITQSAVRVADPERVILFGSAARGQMRPDSDIDILVIVAEGADRPELRRRLEEALAFSPTPVEVFVVSPGEFARGDGEWAKAIALAKRDGRDLYRREEA